MLADRKKKQKWAADPQNTAWAKDQSRFGVKMLQKMGWEKGKGLGVNENGVVDPVKLKYKLDTRGVGCTVSYENNWVAHQDDFSMLLLELNSKSADENGSINVTESVSVVSLEEKSKIQKRVHYKKFTKGKDLSNYKAADMAAIFGSTFTQSAPTTPVNLSDADDVVSDASSCPEANGKKVQKKVKKKKKKGKKKEVNNDKEISSVNTITSKYNINEYFKMRMEQYKKGGAIVANVTSNISSNCTEQEAIIKCADNASVKTDSNCTEAPEVNSKKRKNKQSRKGNKKRKLETNT